MVSLYLLIPIALLLTGIAIALYIWSVNNEQFDDLDNEASRILFDDEAELNNPKGIGTAVSREAEDTEK